MTIAVYVHTTGPQPNLTDQLENRSEARIALDTKVLEVLGFDSQGVRLLIPALYDALVREFKATRGLRKKAFREY